MKTLLALLFIVGVTFGETYWPNDSTKYPIQRGTHHGYGYVVGTNDAAVVGSIAIGGSTVTNKAIVLDAENAVQLGTGTNVTSDTIQFGERPIALIFTDETTNTDSTAYSCPMAGSILVGQVLGEDAVWVSTGAGTNNWASFVGRDEVNRITLTPSMIASYLPITTNHVTGTLSSGVWTKLLIDTTAILIRDFGTVDTGSGDYRWQYQGDETRSFTVNMTSGVSSDSASTVVEFAMSNGGIGVDQDDLAPGVYGIGSAKTADEISPIGLTGYFLTDPLETIAIWVKATPATGDAVITFSGMSIVIIESN